MAIGRLHHLVMDCSDPQTLARFWSALLDWPITYVDDDFVVVAENEHTSGLAFQRVPDHCAPTWPDPKVAQQLHLDVMVDDPAAADDAVLALGARRLSAPDRGQHVYADPAGHPFCLIPRPSWAPPSRATGSEKTTGTLNKDIVLEPDEALELLDTLEELVVSPDRIGSRDGAGEDPGHENLWEYFTTSGATRRLSRARSILSAAYSRTYNENQLEAELDPRPVVYWPDRHPDR